MSYSYTATKNCLAFSLKRFVPCSEVETWERESLHRSRWLVFAFFNRTSLRSRPLSSFLIVIYCQNSVLYLFLFLCGRQRLKSTVTGIIFSTCSEFHSLFPSSIGSLFSSAFQKLLEVIFENETKFESFALIFRVEFPSSHTWREVVLVLFVVWDWNWNCSGRVLSGFSASKFFCAQDSVNWIRYFPISKTFAFFKSPSVFCLPRTFSFEPFGLFDILLTSFPAWVLFPFFCRCFFIEFFVPIATSGLTEVLAWSSYRTRLMRRWLFVSSSVAIDSVNGSSFFQMIPTLVLCFSLRSCFQENSG